MRRLRRAQRRAEGGARVLAVARERREEEGRGAWESPRASLSSLLFCLTFIDSRRCVVCLGGGGRGDPLDPFSTLCLLPALSSPTTTTRPLPSYYALPHPSLGAAPQTCLPRHQFFLPAVRIEVRPQVSTPLSAPILQHNGARPLVTAQLRLSIEPFPFAELPPQGTLLPIGSTSSFSRL